MALWLIPFMIIGGGIVALVGYLVFKYLMKPKTYDEAIAEQRKQIALERNSRSKTKHNQPKKQKTHIKDGSHADKRTNKTVPSNGATLKDTKKVEALKNNTVPSIDKVDGNMNSTKKKSEKVPAKVPFSNTANNSKTNTEIAEDHAELRFENNDQAAKKKQFPSVKNDDTPTTSIDSNFDSKKTTEDLSTDGGIVAPEKDTVMKEKSTKANKVSSAESGKNTHPAESTEKQRETKKGIAKGDSDENIAKSGAKVAKGGADEKTVVKEMKSKQNAEEKVNRPEEKTSKHEEIKVEEKAPPSPYKNRKNENNVAEGQSRAAITVDTAIIEHNSVKEMVASKTDKSSQVASGKRSNNHNINIGANGGIPNGKMSPVAGNKGQKPSINVKQTKRQANDIKVLQKLSDENGGPASVSLLMPLIAKAELSRSEYQNLIDLLLNKQQENGLDAEWIEGGRQDPIVKLKKQLAEKEKALGDEQEAHQALQSKLKELRTELNVEKHTNRQLEETVNGRQIEIQTLKTGLQNMADEKQNFSKQLQQLQSKLNEKRIILNTLKDENTKTKSNLQHELLSQRQQLEMHIAHLNEQHQQEMLAMESQLNQLASQLQEQEAANAQMTDDIRECVIIRERLAHQENQIAHLQQTVMQLEELRQIKGELERHVASGQYEVKRLTNELQTLTDQLNRRNAEIEKFNSTVQNMKIENQELLKENSRNNEQIKFTYNEKAQLQMENEKLRNELQKLGDQYRSSDDVVRLETELESYRNAMADKNAEITSLKERLATLENSKEQFVSRTAALEEENKSVIELKENLQKQKKKNDELRSKNWKVMEALSSMEKTLESKVKGMQCLPHEIKTRERELVLQQLKNLLPNPSNVNVISLHDDVVWSGQLEKISQEIRRCRQQTAPFVAPTEDTFAKESNVNMLDELEKQNNQLQTMVSHYKNIISDTEGMLNSLQNHVEQEENRWGEQVQLLQAELNAITEERNSLLGKMKIQNGCVQKDLCNNEQKLNGIDKLPPILPPSTPINKAMMSS